MSKRETKPKLLRQEEICGPVNWLLANYLLYRIKQEIGSPDAEEFGDLLLAECERPSLTLKVEG